jgi:hypothetical protein
VFRAEVFRGPSDRDPAATGWAAEREGDGEINTVACLENTETSAVGRALANLGLVASQRRPSNGGNAGAERVPTRPRAVADQSSHAALGARLQDRADRATETLEVLARAVRHGFSACRASIVTEHITRFDVDRRTLTRIDRRVRDWLERRLDQVEWPS